MTLPKCPTGKTSEPAYTQEEVAEGVALMEKLEAADAAIAAALEQAMAHLSHLVTIRHTRLSEMQARAVVRDLMHDLAMSRRDQAGGQIGVRTMANYIIADKDNYAIYGIGQTADEAWKNMLCETGSVEIHSRPEYYGKSYINPRECLRSEWNFYPATDALIEKVKSDGGSIAWRKDADGVCDVYPEDCAA